MKADPKNNYFPPDCFQRFGDMKPGTQFRNIEPIKDDKFSHLTKHVHYVKIEDAKIYINETENAVCIDTGKLVHFDDDEYFYPVDAGWIAEIECYMPLPEGIKKKPIDEIITYIFNHTQARQAHDAWHKEVEKYFPHVGALSFCGPKAYIGYIMKHVRLKTKEEFMDEWER